MHYLLYKIFSFERAWILPFVKEENIYKRMIFLHSLRRSAEKTFFPNNINFVHTLVHKEQNLEDY